MDNGQWPMVIRDRVRTPDNNGNPTWMLSWMRFYQGLSMMHFQDEDGDEDGEDEDENAIDGLVV